jgi:hypothetical protein
MMDASYGWRVLCSAILAKTHAPPDVHFTATYLEGVIKSWIGWDKREGRRE